MKRLLIGMGIFGVLLLAVLVYADLDVDVDSDDRLDALYGGTDQDTSGWTGIPYITSGVWDQTTITATPTEINTPLDGATVTLAEFQQLQTIGANTISANQWAMLGSAAATLTGAELSILDGVSGVTAAELSYIGDVTGLIQNQIDGKQALDADLTSYATPTAWRMFYSDAADPFHQEIVLGADGTFLESNGASAAPAFRTLAAGDIPDISATYQPLESTLTDIADGTINENLVNTANPWVDNEIASAITTTATVLDDSDISGDNISAAQATDGTIITNDGLGGAADYNIPAGVKGMVVYVFAEEAQVIVLDLADSDDIITLIDGTALAAGNAIDSDGAFHSSIKLVCHVGDGGTAVSYWYVHSQVGVWVDGGAD